jgi:predicted deacylase
MQNTAIIQALNGVAIAAANAGDMDCVAQLQGVMAEVSSIIPSSRTQVLPANFYDATAASATAFLVTAGGSVGVGQALCPQFDTAAQVAKKLSIFPPFLGT